MGAIAVAALLVAATTTVTVAAPAIDTEVVGGADASPGKWPDATAVLRDGLPYCTGVLVAPTVVLSAAHCNQPGLDQVLVGADTLAAGNRGERIEIVRRIEYPNWQTSMDVLVLVLARPSTKAPRALATGWARFDIIDGAAVAVVGFGAVDRAASTYVDALQEGVTTITDADCTGASGCNAAAQPGGELGAGGMGVDSCSGDSGGPLYLLTPSGSYLAGLTSRGYSDATLTCSQGGIVRPDKIVDWIEEQAGVAISRGPEPRVSTLQVTLGQPAEVQIEPGDPISKHHRYEISVAPSRGVAAVNGEGTVKLCASGVGPGTDLLVVEVTDTKRPSRKLSVNVAVTIQDGVDDGSCRIDFADDGCGCRTGFAGSSAAMLTVIAGLLVLPRRRRRPGVLPNYQ